MKQVKATNAPLFARGQISVATDSDSIQCEACSNRVESGEFYASVPAKGGTVFTVCEGCMDVWKVDIEAIKDAMNSGEEE